MERMPKWADMVLTPLISLALAFAISALVILAIGESPAEALKVMVDGALGSSYGWGFTLYYATNFIFTGLAVTVAYHAGLFNIGGEGQAYIGGIGVALSPPSPSPAAGSSRAPPRRSRAPISCTRRCPCRSPSGRTCRRWRARRGLRASS